MNPVAKEVVDYRTVTRVDVTTLTVTFRTKDTYCRWKALRRSATAAAKSLQSCLTLCDPIPGILQARTLEWVAISFSNAWKGKVKVKSLSRVRLLATPWTAAYQAPPSMGFSRQEYWSGVRRSRILITSLGHIYCHFLHFTHQDWGMER